jgi:hypothetical protein
MRLEVAGSGAAGSGLEVVAMSSVGAQKGEGGALEESQLRSVQEWVHWLRPLAVVPEARCLPHPIKKPWRRRLGWAAQAVGGGFGVAGGRPARRTVPGRPPGRDRCDNVAGEPIQGGRR